MTIVEYVEKFKDIIHMAMEHVTSADKAYYFLREQGFEITREIVRDVWRSVGEKESWATVIRTYGYDKPIPYHWVTEKEVEYSTGYQHIVTAQWYNPNTGETRFVEHSYVKDKVEAFYDLFDEIYDLETDYAEMNDFVLVGLAGSGVVKFIPRR